MRDRLEVLLNMLVAVLLAAGMATVYADDPPKDCKKNPDDPRCKMERKY